MKIRLVGTIMALLLAFLPVSVLAASIDFNDGTAGVAIGGFYSPLGITFSNASWHEPVANQSGTPSTGLFLTDVTDNGFNPPFSPTSSTPIVGVFGSPETTVSILAFDVGSAGARIDAYDAAVGGSLVDFDQFFGVDAGVGTFVTLSVSGPSIGRIEIYQPSPNTIDGVGFDNLSFGGGGGGEVPEPISLILLGSGLLGLWGARRKFKK